MARSPCAGICAADRRPLPGGPAGGAVLAGLKDQNHTFRCELRLARVQACKVALEIKRLHETLDSPKCAGFRDSSTIRRLR